jgi:hypothetical protein
MKRGREEFGTSKLLATCGLRKPHRSAWAYQGDTVPGVPHDLLLQKRHTWARNWPPWVLQKQSICVACVCVRACVRACVRVTPLVCGTLRVRMCVCVRACVCACMRACMRARVRACVPSISSASHAP